MQLTYSLNALEPAALTPKLSSNFTCLIESNLFNQAVGHRVIFLGYLRNFGVLFIPSPGHTERSLSCAWVRISMVGMCRKI